MQRVVHLEELEFEEQENTSLRPSLWKEYIGQEPLKKLLQVSIMATKKRGDTLDHILFFGPPGLGKTTLSYIIAKELNTPIKVTTAPMIEKTGDLAAILTNLKPKEILFIDEIHRLSPAIEEVLYPAMEDFRLDIIIGSKAAAQTIKIDLAPFTLIGATTRAGMLSNPLRDRFGMHFRLEFYSIAELSTITTQASLKLRKPIEPKASLEIASRCRGTPRIALRLLRRVRDFADSAGKDSIDLATTQLALEALGVNAYGLDTLDLRYLELLANAKNRPLGLSTLAASMHEDESTLEEVVEPFLLANGYLERTAKGRIATPKTYEILKLRPPQPSLFS
ncbi:Holliday junction branch migration DNA helicase RuvB [Helicobacter suis]|uniref:Holliday junction branch migration complex subunit RuvB n=2 Tax=Helicobacter suis TaxID=104628 RepID=E7G2M0_9HELI|nr:Holliday junction branch migration DNA helicase RuvB [Helicobacter suis]EFX42369.1 Holliday junction DNA helicase B [Helicobacter suis HS5]EFX43106.1 RuvB protein [Helicobacter suis HS1]BCD44964.1 Holliday junction DNA helicase RuvB [Helicobacter suis]BCD46799.1 Holliday junction DNA helicase RuvB [Helicobacter suis]BCD48556.1 Holliday junction DNA helicase RuvB [Helicobacter suis]